MATQAQQDANKRNAQLSTGPTSEDGKNRVRRNACKHGLSSDGPVAQAVRQEQADARKARFHLELPSETPFKAFLVDQLADASARLDLCASNLDASLNRHSRRAHFAWDDDRTLEAVTLTSKLPKQPAIFILQIKQTLQGCEHLISRWQTIAGLLDPVAGWSPEIKSQALDMLGVELNHRSGATVLDPTDGSDPVSHLRKVVTRQIALLNDKIASFLDEEDATDQVDAASGANALLDKNVRLMLRYHTSAFRQMMRLLGEFRRKPNQKKEFNHPGVGVLQKMNETQRRRQEAAVSPAEANDPDRAEREVREFKESVDHLFKQSVAFRGGKLDQVETNPIASDETKPISATLAPEKASQPLFRLRPVVVPVTATKPQGNRAARRRQARQFATAKR